MNLITARDLIVKCAGGSKMGIRRKVKPAFASLRHSNLFKRATDEERIILLNALADELKHRMDWETTLELL